MSRVSTCFICYTCGNLYCYGGNNPVKYTDPDGRVAQFFVGAVTGFITSAAINVSGQIISSMIQGNNLNDSLKNIDIAEVLASGLGGAVTGAITGGLSSVKAVNDAMTMYKTINGVANVSANIAGTAVSTVVNNAVHNEEVDKNLGLNIGLATVAGIASGLTSSGACKVINQQDGIMKELFVKLTPLDTSRTIMTVERVSKDNSVKEVMISVGQELAGKILE